MSKTRDAEAIIAEALAPIGWPVWHLQAPEDQPAHYIIYRYDVITRSDYVDMSEIEVNIVDHGRDTAPVSAACDAVEAAFDHKTFIGDKVALCCWLERIDPVLDQDRRIIRRRAIISANVYNREERL